MADWDDLLAVKVRPNTGNPYRLRPMLVVSKRFTAKVEVDYENIIRRAAPCWQRFVGQSLENLLTWTRAERVDAL